MEKCGVYFVKGFHCHGRGGNCNCTMVAQTEEGWICVWCQEPVLWMNQD